MANTVKCRNCAVLFAAVATGGRTGICERLSTFDGTRESNLNGRFFRSDFGSGNRVCCCSFNDHFQGFYKAFYPIMVITQTIPTIAIAPLLVLWMGYEMAPKVTLIVIVTFFPIAIGLLEGFQSADKDTVNLLKAMGANRLQIFLHVKFPSSLGRFFASLRISVSYCVVGAVISEWLGGYNGLGVYMTRVRKSYAFDKMFAVIFLISAISLLLMWLVSILQKKCMPWEKRKGE